MEELQGGREGQILRSENRVYRPRGKWSETVHYLLSYIAKNGFHAAPKAFGFDDKGNEVLSFVDGEVFNYPLKGNIATEEALISAASLLRSYHDASSSFLSQHSNDFALPTYWQLQVGPLINEDAKRMANQLRASGFKVFVEKTLECVEEYFVMIGPKLSKERILMVKKTLQKEFALETQIFRYVYED